MGSVILLINVTTIVAVKRFADQQMFFIKQVSKVNYWLKLYDENLIQFTMDSEVGEGLTTTILWYAEDKAHLFPIDFLSAPDFKEMDKTKISLVKWLEKRIIPKNRQFVEEILKLYGLSINNVKGIIDVCKGLSLNDSYWVVPENFQGKFADYNLYENKFSKALSLVAYTGVGSGRTPFTTSPEYTTGGMLRKAWRSMNGKIVLSKGGTSGAANTGLEPYSEYYACQVAEKMGLAPVMYDLKMWKGEIVSTCELFTDIDTAFVYIGRIVKTGGYKAVLQWANSQSKEMFDYFCSMLCFDAIVYNEDRHFGNFGVLRNNKTGKIIRHAPIFDHGMSLFNYGMADDLKDLEQYRESRRAHGGENFDEIVKAFCGKKQKEQLKKLLGFKFTKHTSYNWPSERHKMIERFIGQRVQELLNMIQD